MARNLVRVRHSSGPGGPINRSQVSNVQAYHRSNSLSPMVTDSNGFAFTNVNFYANSVPSLNSVVTTGPKMFHDIQQVNGNNNNKLVNVLTQTEPKQTPEMLQFNVQLDSMPYQAKAMHQRQRHFSTPYGAMASNSALMKPEEGESLKMLLNRSQSVPLSEMFLDPSSLDGSPGQFDSFAGLGSTAMSAMEPTISKSYPTTPLCTDSFKLPQSTSMGTSAASVANNGMEVNNFLSDATIDDLLNNTESVIQSGQDLSLSSVQLTHGINEPSATSSVDELPSSPLMLAKPEFSDLLSTDYNVIDQFEGYPNCDTDFSTLENQNIPFDVVEPIYK